MSNVFIGGSRKLASLSKDVKRRLDNIVEQSLAVLIGDANGADKAVQQYLAERGYRNVVVYCMKGRCRNNVGDWDIHEVVADSKKRGWEYFALKDTAMVQDASYGFMIWDGKSKGTVNNLLSLVEDGKAAVVYLSPEKRFYTVRTSQDLRELVSKCDPMIREKLRVQLRLDERLATA